MPTSPLYLVDVMIAVVDAMRVEILPATVPKTYMTVHYEPGKSNQIIQSLSTLDNTTTLKGTKYPLLAMLMPVPEKRGGEFYSEVIIDKIVIAHLTKTGEGSEPVKDKYASDGVFKRVLHPAEEQFLIQLAKHPNVNMGDFNAFEYTRMDIPGDVPLTENTNDFVDSIEIRNLKLILTQSKNC